MFVCNKLWCAYWRLKFKFLHSEQNIFNFTKTRFIFSHMYFRKLYNTAFEATAAILVAEQMLYKTELEQKKTKIFNNMPRNWPLYAIHVESYRYSITILTITVIICHVQLSGIQCLLSCFFSLYCYYMEHLHYNCSQY